MFFMTPKSKNPNSNRSGLSNRQILDATKQETDKPNIPVRVLSKKLENFKEVSNSK